MRAHAKRVLWARYHLETWYIFSTRGMESDPLGNFF